MCHMLITQIDRISQLESPAHLLLRIYTLTSNTSEAHQILFFSGSLTHTQTHTTAKPQ